MDEAGVTVIGADDGSALTPLHPNYVKLLRTQVAIAATLFVVAAAVLEVMIPFLPRASVFGPALLVGTWAIVRVPLRRHAARGYDMGAGRLRVVRGLWFRSDTFVPFGRVQHIDIHQGALERGLGLATLTVHTAGTHNASVSLPGLAEADAAAMREEIASHIKRETL